MLSYISPRGETAYHKFNVTQKALKLITSRQSYGSGTEQLGA